MDDAGNLVEGGAERRLLRLANVAAGLGADVIVYQRDPRPWQGNRDGIRVVAQPAPLPVLRRILARRAVGHGCTYLHFQDLERVPWGLARPSVTATSRAVYWDIPHVDSYRVSVFFAYYCTSFGAGGVGHVNAVVSTPAPEPAGSGLLPSKMPCGNSLGRSKEDRLSQYGCLP